MDEVAQPCNYLFSKCEKIKLENAKQKYNNCLYTECKGDDPDCVGKIEKIDNIDMPHGCGVGIHQHAFYGGVNYNILSITEAATRKKFAEVDHETIDELRLIQEKMEELVKQASNLVKNKSVLDESIHCSANAIEDAIGWMESYDYDPTCRPAGDVDLSKVTKKNSMVYTFPTTLFIDDPEKLPKSYKSVWNSLKKKVDEHNNAKGAQIVKMSLGYASYVYIEISRGISRRHYMENCTHLNEFDLDHVKENFWMNGKDLEENLNHDIIHSYLSLIIEIFM